MVWLVLPKLLYLHVEEEDDDEEEEEEEEGEKDTTLAVSFTLEDPGYVEQVTDLIISPNTPGAEWGEMKEKEVEATTPLKFPFHEEVGTDKDIKAEAKEEEEEEKEEEEEEEEEEEDEEKKEEDEEEEVEDEEEEEEEEENLPASEGSHKMESDCSSSSCRTDEESVKLEWVKNITLFSFIARQEGIKEIASGSLVTEGQPAPTYTSILDKLKVNVIL